MIFLTAQIIKLVLNNNIIKNKIKNKYMIMEDLKQITQIENEKREQFYEFCKLYDEMMTNDDFFTGDISKSAGTSTNKDELK